MTQWPWQLCAKFAQIKWLKFMSQARNNYKCAVIKTCCSRGTTKLHVSCLPMDVLHFNTWKICACFESESKNHEKTSRRAFASFKLLIHKWYLADSKNATIKNPNSESTSLNSVFEFKKKKKRDNLHRLDMIGMNLSAKSCAKREIN